MEFSTRRHRQPHPRDGGGVEINFSKIINFYKYIRFREMEMEAEMEIILVNERCLKFWYDNWLQRLIQYQYS